MEKMKFEEEWSFLNPYQMTAVLDESPACVVNANVGRKDNCSDRKDTVFISGEADTAGRNDCSDFYK